MDFAHSITHMPATKLLSLVKTTAPLLHALKQLALKTTTLEPTLRYIAITHLR